MDRKTEEFLRKISASIPKEAIDKAHTYTVENREETRERAEYLLKHTSASTGNRWNTATNDRIRQKLQTAFRNNAFDDIKSTSINQEAMDELHKMTNARVQSAIRSGRIPKPTARDSKLKIKQ